VVVLARGVERRGVDYASLGDLRCATWAAARG